MREATLVLWHKGSTANKRIIRFVDDTMESLLRAGVKFDFQIAYQADREHYVDQGINAFPFLQMGDTRLASSDQIMKFLTKLMNGAQTKQEERTPDDDVHDFMMSSLGRPDEHGEEDEDEDDMSGMGDFRARMSEEIERRGISGASVVEARSSSGGTSIRVAPPPRASREAVQSVQPPPVSRTASRPPRRPVRRASSRPAPSRGNNLSEAKTSDVISSLRNSSGDQKRDDELMARFFESE